MKNIKRILALLLVTALVLGVVPVSSVYAEASDGGGEPVASEEPAEEEQPDTVDPAGTKTPEESPEEPPAESPGPSPAEEADGAEPAETEPVTISEEPEDEDSTEIYEPEVVENTAYILSNANREYAGSGDEPMPMDFLYLAYTLADGSAFDHAPTLDELWLTNNDGDHISDFWAASLGQFEACALLYSLDMEAPYYVGYVPEAFSNAEIADWLAGSSEVGQGEEYSDIIYDAAAHLVYVPKTYTDFGCEDFGDAVGKVRLQVLYTTGVESMDELKTTVTVNLNDISAYSDAEAAEELCLSSTSSADVLAMAGNTQIQLPANVILRSVAVSGVPAEKDEYSYDRNTGVLTVNMNPVMVGTVDVDFERDPIMPAYLPPSEYPRTGPINRATMESQINTLDSLGNWSFASTPQEGDAYIIKSGTVAGYYSTVGGWNPGYKKPCLCVYGPYKNQPEHLMHFLYYNSYMSEAGQLLYVNWSGFSKTNSTGKTPIQRYVQFSAQSSNIVQDSPSGRELTSIPAVNLDLFCAHTGIPNSYDDINFSTGDTWYNKDEDYIVDEPILVRVVYVSDDATQAVVIVCTATVQTQAGVGIFRIDLKPPVPPGFPFSIRKVSANTAITNDSSCYSLSGAVYGVYSDPSCNSLLERLTTDGSGNATTSELYEAGTYYIREISASPGYTLDRSIYTVRIDSAGNVTLL